MSSSPRKWLAPTVTGALVGVGTAAATVLLLGFAPPVGIALGAALGAGAGMLFTPMAPKMLEIGSTGVAPTTVPETLQAVLTSANAMENTLRRLESRPLWSGTHLDEKLADLIRGVRTLATTPALQQRTQIDGDVHMLHVLATDYLPTIVNLAIENDRMHTSFSGRASRAQVEKNVVALEEQAGILGEALDRIETDVVRGTTQSVYEHAAFLQLRFEQASTASVLDLDQPLRDSPQYDAGPASLPGVPNPGTPNPGDAPDLNPNTDPRSLA